MSSRCYIVDENDEILGLKNRDEVTKNDIYRVSALWIENSQGEVLLAQRAYTKKNGPGLWGPAVAGTVEDGEGYIENIYKEAQEEIGLTGYVFKEELKELMETPNHRYFLQWFSLFLDKKLNEFLIDPTEVEKIEWVEKEAFFHDARMHPEKYTAGIVKSKFMLSL